VSEKSVMGAVVPSVADPTGDKRTNRGQREGPGWAGAGDGAVDGRRTAVKMEMSAKAVLVCLWRAQDYDRRAHFMQHP